MTASEFSAYLELVRNEHDEPVFIPRQLISRDDWDRAAGEEYFRLHGVFREANADLSTVLQHPLVVIVGEPGMGKTVLAHASMLYFAESHVLPIFLSLSGYTGKLPELLAVSAGSAMNVTAVDGQPVRRAYVFDGLDEVPVALVGGFISELSDLVSHEPNASYVLTCRQAIYEGLRANIPPSFREFFPLGFETDNILDYASIRGVKPERMQSELDRADLWLEASIPFVLRILVDVMLEERSLERSRSDNLALLVDALLEKRKRVGFARQRKALQVLALAMELYSRNELSIDEGVRLLSDALLIETNDARELINELTHTVLIQTASGIRFQVRSFGEYFAARQLENASLSQILSYASFRKTLVLNPSWGNTISYLIEMHPRVREYFVRNEPEWILQSSTAVLTLAQRHQSARLIVESLAKTGRYLLSDLTVNHQRLARLLTSEDATWLRAQAGTNDSVRRANALLLLGHLNDTGVLEEAVAIALDQDVEISLRRAAFVVVGLAGSPELVPRLMDAVDEHDPLLSMLLDAIGSLMTPEMLPHVLPVLMKTATLLSNASARISELRTREMLTGTLDYFLADPNVVSDRNVASYIQPVWKLLKTYHDDEILGRIGHLLANCEAYGIWAEHTPIWADLSKAISGLDPYGVISRTALETILQRNLSLRYSLFPVSELCTVATARWLLKRDPPKELVLHIGSCANDDVREVLRPASGGIIEAQNAARKQLRQQEADRQSCETQERSRRQHTVRTAEDIDLVLQAFAGSTSTQWPEINDNRKAWLGAHISTQLAEANALCRVKWTSEVQVSFPGALRLGCELAGYYGLPLENDVLLVHSLLALEASFLKEYHRRRPLSAKAIAEIERMLADPALPSGAVSHFLSFVQAIALESALIYESLLRIAASASQTDLNRQWAATILAKSSCSVEVLLTARKETKNSLIETTFLDALVDRQHLPTIFERINRLPVRDEDLVALERPFPETTEMQWVGKIRSPRAWNMLAGLRRRTLRLALPNLTGVVESALAGIDKTALIGLMEEQLLDTPEEWRQYTKHRMAGLEREVRFEHAAKITFDEVLARLSESSINYRVRLLCEGPTDVPIYRSLLDSRGLGAVELFWVNGWDNVLSPHFDVGPYLDGFHYVFFVLDGDNGRDLARPERPIKPRIQQLVDKLERAGVGVRVLRRYGIENYFTQTALEKILRKDLSGSFPLSETLPVSQQIGGYDKNQNVEVIGHMSTTDFDGTDLAEIFEVLRKRLESNA